MFKDEDVNAVACCIAVGYFMITVGLAFFFGAGVVFLAMGFIALALASIGIFVVRDERRAALSGKEE